MPLTVFQSIPLDGIVIVTSPQELVGMIVEKAVNMATDDRISPYSVWSKTCPTSDCPGLRQAHLSVWRQPFGRDRGAPWHSIHGKYCPCNPKLAAALRQGRLSSCTRAPGWTTCWTALPADNLKTRLPTHVPLLRVSANWFHSLTKFYIWL